MWVQPLAFSISTLLIYSSTWWKRSEALKRKLPRALIVVFLFLLLVFKSHSLSFSVNLPQRPSNVKLATLWRLMPTLAVREATFQLWELTHKVAAKKKKAKVRHCNSLYLDVQRSSLVAPRGVKVNEKVIACRSRQCVLVLCTSSSVTSPPPPPPPPDLTEACSALRCWILEQEGLMSVQQEGFHVRNAGRPVHLSHDIANGS